jgi:hypothetical protein
MTQSDMVWIVTWDDVRGDNAIRGVFTTAEAAYAYAREEEGNMVDPTVLRVMAHEVLR